MSNLLFVCTANICRSPAAEAIARSRFGSGSHLFASAGFLYEDREATPEMVKMLSTIGVDASSHTSAIITQDRGLSADLILTMESRHVQDIGLMSPELLERCLPLAEAAERLKFQRCSVSNFVSQLAGRDPLSYLDQKWDVADPYKRSKRHYKKAVQEISELVDTVVGALD